MVRAGRELEVVVALLEQALRGTSFDVQSPDLVVGQLTRVEREIDVSVRSGDGERILVMLECRDRKRGSDVTWIEQLATKRKDVGAERAIAVSSASFSSAARRMAAAEGIGLHDLRRLKPEDAFSLLGLQELQVQVTWIRPGVPHIEVLGGSDKAIAWISRTPIESPDEPFFLDTDTGSRVGLWQILANESALAGPNVVRIPADGVERHVTTLRREFAGDHMRYEVPTPNGSIPIATLEVELHLKAEQLRVPLAELSRYTQEQRLVAETAEFRFELEGETLVFSLHRLEELEQLAASLRPVDPVRHGK